MRRHTAHPLLEGTEDALEVFSRRRAVNGVAGVDRTTATWPPIRCNDEAPDPPAAGVGPAETQVGPADRRFRRNAASPSGGDGRPGRCTAHLEHNHFHTRNRCGNARIIAHPIPGAF